MVVEIIFGICRLARLNSDGEEGFVLLNNARDPTHGQGLIYLFAMNELD